MKTILLKIRHKLFRVFLFVLLLVFSLLFVCTIITFLVVYFAATGNTEYLKFIKENIYYAALVTTIFAMLPFSGIMEEIKWVRDEIIDLINSNLFLLRKFFNHK